MRKNFKTIVFLVLVLFVFASCEKDKQIPAEPEEIEKEDPVIGNVPSVDLPDESPKDYFHKASFVLVNDFFTGGGAIDLATGNVYNQSNVVANLHNVDLVYLNFDNATGHNIALPTSKVLSVNEFGENVQYGWRLQNKGLLYSKTNLQPQDIEWFNNLKSVSQIRNAVDSVVNLLGADNSIDRLKNVDKDQILFFKSLDRNIVSVVYVNSALKTSPTSQVKLTIKSDVNSLAIIAPAINSLKNLNNYYADTLTFKLYANSNAEYFVDLKKKKIFTQAEIDAPGDYPKYSDVSFLLLYNHNIGSNIVPTFYIMNPLLQEVGVGANANFYGNNTLKELLQAIGGFPQFRFRRIYTSPINSAAGYSTNTFENVRLNNNVLNNYFNTSLASDYALRVGNPLVNYVYRIADYTNGNSWGAIKVVSVDMTKGEEGEIKLAVKYTNSID